MAKSIISLGLYLVKTQTLFLALPIAVCLLSVALRSNDAFSSVQFLALVGFWTVVFPAAAINGPMGSLHQKELFVSLPISPVSFGVVQPVIVFTIYGTILSVAYLACEPNSWNDPILLSIASSLFVSSAALFALTCLLINLLKNAAIGLVLALIYMIFGMFTTGTGQGPFYLFQWFRPRPMTGTDDYIGIQLMGLAVLLAVNYAVIKYRTRFQIIPY